MSKSETHSNTTIEALRRPARSLDLKPLDFEQRIIDDLIASQELATQSAFLCQQHANGTLLDCTRQNTSV
jgi:hypothetical protein